jgi:L-threonylcarbamoyladenylate synthase
MPADFRIKLAARYLRGGGVIAYPTEGVWGVGCDPDNADAVQQLLDLKRRDPGKGVILIAASIAQVEPYLEGLSNAQRAQLAATWPGPQTWIVPANAVSPACITGGRPGLALRVSRHPVVRALCEAFGGPIVSTSANPSGRPAPRSALRVHRYFHGRIDYVLAGALGGQRGPTPIRDLLTGDLLRAG